MAIAKSADFLSLLSHSKSAPMAVLIHGADRSAVLDLCQKALGKILPSDHNALNLTQLTDAQVPNRFYEEFSATSMFGGKSVVWVTDAGDQFAKAMASILDNKESGSFVLADADSLPKTSRLRKLFESHDHCLSVALYEETPQEFRGRLSRQVTAQGLTITDQAAEKLAELVSSSRAAADSEITKLMIYCHGQSVIEVEDVEAICGDTSEASLDEFVDAVFQGDLHAADQAMTVMNASSSRGCLSVVLQHVVRLQNMSAQVASGATIDSVVNTPRSGIFFKRRPVISHQLRNWDIEALLDAEMRISAAVLQTRQFPELVEAIESRTVLAISRMARAQGTSGR